VNEETRVTVAAQTPDEIRIAERYRAVLADISRCAQAVRDGDWPELADTADDLCRRAALLAEAAGKLSHTEPSPRGDVVATLVATHRDAPPAAQVLHPVATATIPKTTMTDPFTHPSTQQDHDR
jgi:hypothetical protein